MEIIFQLQDSVTEGIVGEVSLIRNQEIELEDEINIVWRAWELYNSFRLFEYEYIPLNVNDFVKYFNYHYQTQIESVDINSVQI